MAFFFLYKRLFLFGRVVLRSSICVLYMNWASDSDE
jgi:hypothetical protein